MKEERYYGMRVVRLASLPADQIAVVSPKAEAYLRLSIETVCRQNIAALFGAPITVEQARQEALDGLSDRDRALLARPVGPEEAVLLLTTGDTPREQPDG